MSTIRRLYFYVLALISAEVVIWGVIGLLRTIVSESLVGSASLLATGLSFLLVGMPIFFLHWRIVQRDAARDAEERSSLLRAVFLYAVLFATFSPIVFAVLALINRALAALLGLSPFSVWFGEDGTAVDNVIALLVNGVAFAYFWSVLRSDWLADLPEHFLSETRRLYRYLWMATGLVMTVSGVFNLLSYLLNLLGSVSTGADLAGGLSLVLVGAPLWWYFWQQIQSSLIDPVERRSLLRLVVLYAISLAGVVGVLSSAGGVLNGLIRWILGESQSLVEFLQNYSGEIAAAIPLAVMWAYYGKILNQEVASLSDQPRRAALHRLYYYILSLLGLAVAFSGLLSLASFLARMALAWDEIVVFWRDQLSGSLAALLVGLPLWLMTWPLMQQEAARLDDVGDHSRRSVLRKAYLYFVLFTLVIGAMALTGQILYALFNALLGQPADDLARTLLELVLWLAVDVAFLVYHWQALRQDGRIAQQSLGKLHADFPTLILAEEGESLQFAEATVQALQRTAPRLPVAVNRVERGAPDEVLLAAKAILLPFNLAVAPPEPLRLWLADFHGQRILVPESRAGWVWLGQVEKSTADQAREAAQTLRQMAEGEAIRQSVPNSPWVIFGYVLGVLFGLPLLIGLFSIMISSLFR